MRDWLTTTEAAGRLGVTEQRVRQLLARDAFPGAWRAGDRGWWRIPQVDVEALCEGRSTGNETARIASPA